MTKPNTTPIAQKMMIEGIESKFPAIFEYDTDTSFDSLEHRICKKISKLIAREKAELSARVDQQAKHIEMIPTLCLHNGTPCLEIYLDIDGISIQAYIPIEGLAYPFDTFENFEPWIDSSTRPRRDPEMVAQGKLDRAAQAAALHRLADNVARDPVPAQP